MFFVSEILTTAPDHYQSALQRMTYEALQKLGIPFERVVTDEAITMEDCVEINKKLGVEVVKTLFLCNRQQTAFYLYITTAEKSFKSKDFSAQLGIPRVSFAPPEHLERMLGAKVGAATIFGVLMDQEGAIQVVMDEDVLGREWYGCSDGTTTCYLKIKTSHILHDFLPYANHTPIIIRA